MKSGAALLFLGAVVALFAIACGGDDQMQAPYPSDEIVEVPQRDAAAVTANPCAHHAEGCPCILEDGEAECGLVIRVSDGYVSCSKGKRLCRYGKWSACEGDQIAPHAK